MERCACTFEEDPKEKRLISRDSGIGINPEDIDRVFEKGFTGATGRTKTGMDGFGTISGQPDRAQTWPSVVCAVGEGKIYANDDPFPKYKNLSDPVFFNQV